MVLLLLPISTTTGIIAPVDALFTSTSAVCVTGLIVLDTAKDFTLFGQAVILALIQFGGLGIMTFSIALLSLMGGSISIRWGITLRSLYSETNKLPIRSLLVRIVVYTLIIESTAAAILYTQYIKSYAPWEALWHSVFHAVSAFCNAGFSTHTDNLMGYWNNPVVLMTVAASIILGGLGFLVLHEITNCRIRGNRGFFNQFTVHTRLVLMMTTILIFFGMGTVLVLEWNYILKDMGIIDKALNAFFQSVTCRTAGFNTVDTGALRESSLFFMIFLMFTGGAPGSIAGGIKLTTMGVIFGLLLMKIRGRQQLIFWGRALDNDTINKSTTLFILALLFVFTSCFMLLAAGTVPGERVFLPALFETFSAFGTVGLSTGITQTLSMTGKLILCVVMYAGRLGPLTFIGALAWVKKDMYYEVPEEHIMIG